MKKHIRDELVLIIKIKNESISGMEVLGNDTKYKDRLINTLMDSLIPEKSMMYQ